MSPESLDWEMIIGAIAAGLATIATSFRVGQEGARRGLAMYPPGGLPPEQLQLLEGIKKSVDNLSIQVEHLDDCLDKTQDEVTRLREHNHSMANKVHAIALRMQAVLAKLDIPGSVYSNGLTATEGGEG